MSVLQRQRQRCTQGLSTLQLPTQDRDNDNTNWHATMQEKNLKKQLMAAEGESVLLRDEPPQLVQSQVVSPKNIDIKQC